ncbi:MAG: F-box protein 18 (helicase) [Vicingaceae bacterium]
MKLTEQQNKVISFNGDMVVNAVAGSGKTTTLIEYAKAKPQNSKILYIVFNKSVKVEAKRKFKAAGLNNVTVESAHSLAYNNIIRQNGYKLNPKGYKVYELVDLLGIETEGEKHLEFVIANHINQLISCFCNSEKEKVQDVNYPNLIIEKKARTFVDSFYPIIEKKARIFLSMMDKGQIEVTHDFYLKKYQLSKPTLNYDYVLFDEGQDASPVMLSIFLNQKATKVIVGDRHQQIYSWRYAVNALEKVEFSKFELSSSFRFPQDIADLSERVLDWKNHLEKHEKVNIKGEGSSVLLKSKAVLARTNLGLLLQAIDFINDHPQIEKVYFEGNINSYTYAEDGASLYDVLNLYQERKNKVKNKMIRQMQDISELEEYIEKTNDVELGLMVKIVKEHGSDIHKLLKRIKELHVEDDKKDEAEIIFSTVHRSKGMEYDTVYLASDFIDEARIMELKPEIEKGELKPSRLIEEINLLYVAITRTKCELIIDQNFLPIGVKPSKSIITRKPSEKITDLVFHVEIEVEKPDNKSYSYEDARKKNTNAYTPWSDKLDDELTRMFCEGYTSQQLKVHFNRSYGSIKSRIKKLELSEKYN